MTFLYQCITEDAWQEKTVLFLLLSSKNVCKTHRIKPKMRFIIEKSSFCFLTQWKLIWMRNDSMNDIRLISEWRYRVRNDLEVFCLTLWLLFVLLENHKYSCLFTSFWFFYKSFIGQVHLSLILKRFFFKHYWIWTALLLLISLV